MKQNTWRYAGVCNDENYYVSCSDCERYNKCEEKAAYEFLADDDNNAGDKSCPNFFPMNSCAFCSQTYCGYRWDYPC